MEREDAQTVIRLLGQIQETQAANLQVQRKLLDTVVTQYARNEEASKRAVERNALLQDRTMEMLILKRRILSYGLPIIVVVVLFVWVLFRLPR